MYAINDKNSYERVSSWIKQIHAEAPQNVKVFLVGNKADMESE